MYQHHINGHYDQSETCEPSKWNGVAGCRGAKLLSVSRQKFLELSTLRLHLPETLSAASETHGLWQLQIYI